MAFGVLGCEDQVDLEGRDNKVESDRQRVAVSTRVLTVNITLLKSISFQNDLVIQRSPIRELKRYSYS